MLAKSVDGLQQQFSLNGTTFKDLPAKSMQRVQGRTLSMQVNAMGAIQVILEDLWKQQSSEI